MMNNKECQGRISGCLGQKVPFKATGEANSSDLRTTDIAEYRLCSLWLTYCTYPDSWIISMPLILSSTNSRRSMVTTTSIGKLGLSCFWWQNQRIARSCHVLLLPKLLIQIRAYPTTIGSIKKNHEAYYEHRRVLMYKRVGPFGGLVAPAWGMLPLAHHFWRLMCVHVCRNCSRYKWHGLQGGHK